MLVWESNYLYILNIYLEQSDCPATDNFVPVNRWQEMNLSVYADFAL